MENIKRLSYPDLHLFFDDLMGSDNLGRPERYIYRGQGRGKWQLIPSALRQSGAKKLDFISPIKHPNPTIGQLLSLEAASVRTFAIRANTQGISVPMKFDPIAPLLPFAVPMDMSDVLLNLHDYLDIYALAQHYGVPTRLLDWSRDALVAAFFAVSGAFKHQKDYPNDSFVIWMLHTEAPIYCAELGLRTCVPSYAHNPNIHAQQGVMTYTPRHLSIFDSKYNKDVLPSLDSKFDPEAIPALKRTFNPREISSLEGIIESCHFPPKFLEPAGIDLQKTPVLYKIEIPYTGVEASAKFLCQLGYTHSRIFPGLGDIVADMANPMSGQNGFAV